MTANDMKMIRLSRNKAQNQIGEANRWQTLGLGRRLRQCRSRLKLPGFPGARPRQNGSRSRSEPITPRKWISRCFPTKKSSQAPISHHFRTSNLPSCLKSKCSWLIPRPQDTVQPTLSATPWPPKDSRSGSKN